MDWRSLDRMSLDKAYNNAAAVRDSVGIIAGWEKASAALRSAHPQTLDLAYGPRPRNKLDFFSAGADTPTLVFIHGGYWQSRSKEVFSFVAAGPLELGISVALPGYTLAPDLSLDGMVAEVRAALDYLGRNLPALGGNPDELWISGWSAGAHLAAMALDHPRVRGGILISGIYDLEPIRHCYVNDKLGLDAETARRNSPSHFPARGPVPLEVFAGADELARMRRQSADFSHARRSAGLPGNLSVISGANHFTILDHLHRPDGQVAAMLPELIARQTTDT